MDKFIVAALGDSITAGTPLWDPDPAVRRDIGAVLDEQSQWPYWAAMNDPHLSFAITASTSSGRIRFAADSPPQPREPTCL